MFWNSGPGPDSLGRTNVIWQAEAWPGFEHVCVESWDLEFGFTIDGLVVANLNSRPSRIWYKIDLSDDWFFRSLQLAQMFERDPSGDGPIDVFDNSLDLVRSESGRWDHDWIDGDPDLSSCTDIDIAVTPFTNSLPIRRLQLGVGESADIDVVFIAVPDLTLAPARQRYTRLTEYTYRYESLTSGYTNEITVDDDGLVVDYPGLFRRVWG